MGGGRAACKPVTPQLPPSGAGLWITGPGPRAGPPRVTCTHVLGFQNISLGTHLSPLSQEPRMDPTKPRKLPGSPGQGRGGNRRAAWLPGGRWGAAGPALCPRPPARWPRCSEGASKQAQPPRGQGAPSTDTPQREHHPHGRGVRDLGAGRGPHRPAARPRPLPSMEPVTAGQPGVAAGPGHAPPSVASRLHPPRARPHPPWPHPLQAPQSPYSGSPRTQHSSSGQSSRSSWPEGSSERPAPCGGPDPVGTPLRPWGRRAPRAKPGIQGAQPWCTASAPGTPAHGPRLARATAHVTSPPINSNIPETGVCYF